MWHFLAGFGLGVLLGMVVTAFWAVGFFGRALAVVLADAKTLDQIEQAVRKSSTAASVIFAQSAHWPRQES